MKAQKTKKRKSYVLVICQKSSYILLILTSLNCFHDNANNNLALSFSNHGKWSENLNIFFK